MKYKKRIIVSVLLVLALVLVFALHSKKKTDSKESVSITEKKEDFKKQDIESIEEEAEITIEEKREVKDIPSEVLVKSDSAITSHPASNLYRKTNPHLQIKIHHRLNMKISLHHLKHAL